jgi:methionyl-tRNA formyltransferase
MRLIFAGTPEVAAVSLRKLASRHDVALVITRPDAPTGRKKVITPSAVALAAKKLDLPVLKAARIGEVELAAIESADADLGVVVAYGALLNQAALDQLDWWNLHFSLLPSWRGATPLQHSIWHAQGQGISVFRLNAGMDTGDILGALSLTYPQESTAGELLPQLADQGSDLILELLENGPQGMAQSGTPSFAPKLTRKEARLDFGETAALNARKVMALNPEPMAWTEFRGEPIRILRARAVGNVDWSSLDETVSPLGSVQQSGESVLVTCGEGTRLQLIEVQPGGKRVMTGMEWFRGLQGSVVLD